MRRSSRVVFLASFVSSLLSLAGCDDGGDPSESVRISGLATESTELAGPNGSGLLIPAGASDTDVTIVLSAPSGRRPGPASTTIVSDGFRLEPEGKTFNVPLEITIPITPSRIPAGKTIDDVVVVRAPVGTGSDAFVPLPTRRSGNAVTAQTEHFSDFYAIVIDDGALPFGTCGDEMCTETEGCDLCPLDCGVCLPSSDSTPPTVAGVASPQTTSNVAADATIVIDFSEDVMPASISTTSFDVEDDLGNAVAGVLTVTGKTVTFTPAMPLAPSMKYNLIIGGVRDLAGNLMAAGFMHTFETSLALTLASSTPTNGATSVPQNSTVNLTLSGFYTVSSLTMQSTDGPCSGSVQLSTDGFATCIGGQLSIGATSMDVMVIPALPFIGSATVSVRFTMAARDAAGFSLAGIAGPSFTVVPDTTPPAVVVTSPTQSANGVAPDTSIVISFDEPVNPATITAANVRLTQDGQTTTCSLMVNGAVVTLVPMSPLLLDTNYTVSIMGVGDRSNNVGGPLPGISFRTIGAPRVVTATPQQGAVGVHPDADLVLGFDRAVDTVTLSMQATDSAVGACTGTVRLSDGTTCFGGTIVVNSASQITVRANTLPTLASMTLQITSGAVDSSNIPFAGGTEHSFRVSPTSGWAYAIAFGPYTDGGMSTGIGATGVARADNLCDPSGAGLRKALLIDANRYPCLVDDCGLPAAPAVSSSDWVLETSTHYVNGAGDFLFTTHATAPINPPPGSLGATFGSGVNFHWGGSTTWTQDSMDRDCGDHLNGSNTLNDTLGWGDASDASWLAGGLFACDIVRPIVCVAQVPATPLPTH